MSDILQKLRDFLDSEEGKKSREKFIKKIVFEQQLKKNNVERIKKMFNDQKSFNLLVNKIIAKHDDAWSDKCYKKGVMPYPWELMYALFNLAEFEGKISDPIDELTKNFPSFIYTYKGWQFAVTHGQGSVCSVYYRKKLKYRD